MNVATATMEHNMMVRLCCGQRHSGTVCPDGMVVCCICFERVSQQQLNTIDGKKRMFVRNAQRWRLDGNGTCNKNKN